MVDCGATSYIMNDESTFTKFNQFPPKEHYIELADGTKTSNIVKKKGTALIH